MQLFSNISFRFIFGLKCEQSKIVNDIDLEIWARREKNSKNNCREEYKRPEAFEVGSD